MKKLLQDIETKLTQNNMSNFQEEDPTYGEAFSHIAEQIIENKYYVLGLVILLVIAKII